MKINLLPYPANADFRHAKVSSLLAAGDSSVDIFAVNDEVINAFKNEGYLEPLQDDVMNEETAQAFQQEYRLHSRKKPADVMPLLSRKLIPVRKERSFPWLQTAHFRRPRYFLYRAA